ncbi:MAG: hypothetical protein WC421_02835 [Elusimicrobiales bacterium]
MAALDTERDTAFRDGKRHALPVAAGAKIYAGGLTALNGSGYAVPASDAAGLVVYGRAEATVDNALGQNGDAAVEVKEGCFCYGGSGFTAADAGKAVFVADDQTVNKTGGTHKVFAGVIKEVVAADEVFIQVSPDFHLFGNIAAAVAAAASANAPTQGETYAQADVQAIATLANELKAQLNAVIAALKAAGLMWS